MYDAHDDRYSDRLDGKQRREADHRFDAQLGRWLTRHLQHVVEELVILRPQADALTAGFPIA